MLRLHSACDKQGSGINFLLLWPSNVYMFNFFPLVTAASKPNSSTLLMIQYLIPFMIHDKVEMETKTHRIWARLDISNLLHLQSVTEKDTRFSTFSMILHRKKC